MVFPPLLHHHPHHQPQSSHQNVKQEGGVVSPPSRGFIRSPADHILERKNTFPGCLAPLPPPSPSHRRPGNALMQPPPKELLCQSVSVTMGQQPLQQQQQSRPESHKKLDRSMSEPAEKRPQQQPPQQQQPSNSSRYKTELCRPFEENGTCKYGDKCQFAHGGQELRNLQRHPKYKTELCRTFHTTGFCPYGPRCHFIHNSEDTKKTVMTTLQGSGSGAPPPKPKAPLTRAETIAGEMLLNGLNSAIKSMASKTVSCPTPIRPKAMSIGSFSLGSSGEQSPPSSQSGSPTSLNSFFNEETFIGFPFQSAFGNGANAVPDFASLLGAGPAIGLLQKPLAEQYQTMQAAAAQMMASVRPQPPVGSDSPGKTKSESGNSTTSSGIGSASPPSHHYPGGAPSPVSSLDSELDILSLNGSSPVPSQSPSPSQKSQLLTNVLPRLPIFTRFANNGNNSD